MGMKIYERYFEILFMVYQNKETNMYWCEKG